MVRIAWSGEPLGPRGPAGPTGPGADVTGAEIEAARDAAQAFADDAATKAAEAEAAKVAAEAVGTTNDGIMAAVARDDESEFSDELKTKVVQVAAPRLQLPVDTSAYGGAPSAYVTLISGMEGETAVGSGATVTANTNQYESGDRSWRVVSNASATEARLRVTPADAPHTFPYAAAVCARIYVPDASKITTITIDIYGDSGLTFGDRWSRINTVVRPLRSGWNTIRHVASQGNRVPGKWGNVYRVDVIGTNPSAAAGNEFTVDRVWVECPPKATLSFIEDHCSVNFLNYGYPGLKALGVPVYWALNPLKLGWEVVDQGLPMTRMTEAQIESVAWENRNLVGAHAWGDNTTAGMTPAEIRADVMRTTKWLQARGYMGWLFRPAWWEEMATNYAAATDLYLGMATYKADSGLTCWPPPDWNNMPRYHLYQSRTTAQLDSLFQTLKDCRGHVNLFTHMVAPLAQCGLYDTDLDKWNYLLGKIETGIAEGWLEPASWLELWTRTGGRFRPGAGGGLVAEFFDDDGDLAVRTMP